MRHFCPQVFRHQLLDAAVWQTPRQYSSQDFAAKAGTVPNDITAISAIALRAISARMISPMESPVAKRIGSIGKSSIRPNRLSLPQTIIKLPAACAA
jgi:hypothetical protein